MKPVHLVIGAALLAVGAVLFLLRDDGGARDAGRGGADGPGSGRLAPVGTKTPGSGRDPGASTTPADAVSITASVQHANGTPAGGAAWTLSGSVARTGTAADDGRIAVGDLPPGHYRLDVNAGDEVGGLSFRVAHDIDLGTIVLRPGVAVSGHVYDALGKPLTGAQVEAIHDRAEDRRAANRWMAGARTESVAAVALTNAQGAYTLAVPGHGRYSFRAGAPGYALAVEDARPIERPRDGLDFYLAPAEMVTGTVWGESNRPLPGARVTVTGGAPGMNRAPVQIAVTTGSAGAFALSAPDSLWLNLTVDAPGYARHVRRFRPPSPPLDITLVRGLSLRLRAVDAATGAPATLVRVYVEYLGAIDQGVTDRDGTIVFSQLATKDSGGTGGQNLYLGGNGYAPRQVPLNKIEPSDGWIDLEDIELTRGGTVRGRVLVRGTNEPLAGARVQAFGGRNFRLMAIAGAAATSDEGGTFELTGVPPETAALIATHPEYAMILDARKLFQRNPPRLFKAGQAVLEKDVFVAAARALRGKVVTPDGEAAPDAKVIRTRETIPFSQLFDRRDAVFHTDAKGHFEIAGLQRGERVPLVASHPGFGNSEPKDFRAGDEAAVLQLTVPSEIAGSVIDDAGEPIAGVKVSAARPKAGRAAAGLLGAAETARPGVTGDDGRFLIRNAPRGELALLFEHESYQAVKQRVVTAGRRVDLEDVTLLRGRTIKGVVEDEEARPLADVGVSISVRFDPKAGGKWPSDASEGRVFASTRTDADGRFGFYGLLDAEYQVSATHEGLFSARPVVRSGTEDMRLVLKRPAQLTGSVVGDGGPLAGASVQARTQRAGSDKWETAAWATTDKNGKFTLPRLAADGAYQLQVSHRAFETRTVAGARPGGPPLTVSLQPGLRLAATVVDEGGSGVASVSFEVKQDTERRWARTDAEGRFVVGGLADEPITLTARRTGDYITPPPIEAQPGDDLKVVLVRGRKIAGKVTDGKGDPVTGLQILALDGSGKRHTDFGWAADGTFEIRGLADGSYRIVVARVRGNEMETVAEIADVAAGTNDLVIRVTK
ncbi:MAG: carboxypeptidase regulatory-like domain-containing protein [Planctomycetota bacterium]|nr:carboxypeptidase regulatory-like domain-containing protein [Planctomycetota bacterium]